MAYVTIDSGNVTGVYNMPQPELNGFQIVADDDVRISEFNNALALKTEARIHLIQSDQVATRCLKAGVSYPSEWLAYDVALRGIIATGAGGIPSMPAYPANT